MTQGRPREALWAVVVARTGPHAKSRLAPVLNNRQRQALALEMLDHVLRVCSGADWLAGIVAAVDANAARQAALRAGAVVVLDGGTGQMNAAVAAGIGAAVDRGAGAVLVLPGDLPLLSGGDLRALRDAADGHPRALVVGASRGGDGTNGLFLRPPRLITPAFGPPSVDRHLTLGQAAGAYTARLDHLGLALDVDYPADLAAAGAGS